MNYAKNYTMKLVIQKSISYFFYFACSSFTAVIPYIWFTPVIGLFTDSSYIHDIFFSVCKLSVMLIMTAYFAAREGWQDTDPKLLRYSVSKSAMAIFTGSLLFYFYLFMLNRYNLYEYLNYFASPFLSKGFLLNLIPVRFPDILFDAVLIILNFFVSLVFYAVGRRLWIQNKRKKIKMLQRL